MSNVTRRGVVICANLEKIRTKDRLKLLGERCHISLVHHSSRQSIINDFRRLAAERPQHAVVFFPGSIGAADNRWDKELFSPLAGNLKLAVGTGAGYDHVDVDYLTRIGTCYANSPIAVAEPTALTTVSLILQTIRATTQAEMTLRRGQWKSGLEYTEDIRDLTIGIVGNGRIGQIVQKKLQALGAGRILYTSRRRLSLSVENGAIHKPLDQLLAQSDLVTLHCPLTGETRHLLSDAQFASMKQGAYIVNTSRGPVVDESALVRAMKSGRIARVGLDVFENEPDIHPYLLTSERATLLPHWGSNTKKMLFDVEHECLDNLEHWLATGRPQTPVNTSI